MSAVTPAARYAWVVDVDLLEPGDFGKNAVGLMGPRNLDAELKRRLDHGAGVKWRCKDDDGEEYYAGRLVWADGPADPQHMPEEVVFAPLWDFAEPDAGAVDIEYQLPGNRWIRI